MKTIRTFLILPAVTVAIMLLAAGCAGRLTDGGLRIGWAIEDITPDGPVSLRGQYYERISEYVQCPLKVTALAIESVSEDGEGDRAIMISADLVGVGEALQDSLRRRLDGRLPGFDLEKVFLNATHTHSAPEPDPDSPYGKILLEKLSMTAEKAWAGRQPAGISRSIRYAVTGHNRRVQYTDGSTQMYGSTAREDVLGLEGPVDPAVDMLFCWDLQKNLTGIMVNVSCPSQVTEARYYVSSDYWGELRKLIEEDYPGDVYILPQCGAAGDISPRDLTRAYRAGEPNMWDVPGSIEIASRLAGVIKDAYLESGENIQTSVVFRHTVERIDLPARMITQQEYGKALEKVEEIRSREPENPASPLSAWNRFLNEIAENEKTRDYGPWDNKLSDFGQLKPCEAIIERYLDQESDPLCPVEVHAIRLGDIALATNPFELYVDYGLSIEGRCRADQTFVVQLSSGTQGYLPTTRAIDGGGYSAMITRVGADGGRMLVDETVRMINSLWSE